MTGHRGSGRWRRRLGAAAPLLASLLLHLLVGLSIGGISLPGIAAPPAPPPPPPLKIELVDTPESSRVDEAPESPEFYSNRDTRSQQPTESPEEATLGNRPRILDEGDSHDLRPVAGAPVRSPRVRAAPPSAPASESAASDPQRARSLPAEPEPEGTVPTEVVESSPAARPSRPAPAIPPAEAPRRGASQEGRLTFSPAEREELARASALGEFSYEAAQHFFADYHLEIRDRVEQQWTLHLMTQFLVPGRYQATVEFLVLADGSIEGLRTVQLEGGADFAAVCTRSIRKAAPFGPVPYDRVPGLPESLRGIPIRYRFTFRYR